MEREKRRGRKVKSRKEKKVQRMGKRIGSRGIYVYVLFLRDSHLLAGSDHGKQNYYLENFRIVIRN